MGRVSKLPGHGGGELFGFGHQAVDLFGAEFLAFGLGALKGGGHEAIDEAARGLAVGREEEALALGRVGAGHRGGALEVVEQPQALRTAGDPGIAAHLANFLTVEAVDDLGGGHAHVLADGLHVGIAFARLAGLEPVGDRGAVVVELDAHADAVGPVLAMLVHVERVGGQDLHLEPHGASPGAQAHEQLAVDGEREQREGFDLGPRQAGDVGGLAPGAPTGFEPVVGGVVGAAVAAQQVGLQPNAVLAEHVVAQLDEVVLGPLVGAALSAGAGAHGGELAREVVVDADGGGAPGLGPCGGFGGLEAARGRLEAGEVFGLELATGGRGEAVEPLRAIGGGFARAEDAGEEAHGCQSLARRQVSCMRLHSAAASIRSRVQRVTASSSPAVGGGSDGQAVRHSLGRCRLIRCGDGGGVVAQAVIRQSAIRAGSRAERI
jgi:hypothetical protein